GYALDLSALAEEFACAFEEGGTRPVQLCELEPGVYAVDIGDTRLGMAYGESERDADDGETLLVSIGPRVHDPAPCDFLAQGEEFLRSVAKLLHEKAPVSVTLQTRAEGVFDAGLCAAVRAMERGRDRTASIRQKDRAPCVTPRRVVARSNASAQRLTRLGQFAAVPREDGTVLKLYFDGEDCRSVPARFDPRDPGAFAARAVFSAPAQDEELDDVPMTRHVARATALASAALGFAQSAAASVVSQAPTLPF
ncbi:MAG: hypothetical protein AAF618_09600, partial [Pseudomonadota bacterium]